MRYLPVFSLFILFAIATCTPTPQAQVNGTLQGHVDIGPLTPVEKIGVPTPTVPPEVYAARKLVVYQADGKTEAARVSINGQGNYQVSLPPGSYVVDLVHSGMDRGKNLPQTVEIRAGETTRLDISIDTGIR